MKKLLLLYIVFVNVIFVYGQDTKSALEVWYKFDYKEGSEYITDYSGNGRHLVPGLYYGGASNFTDFKWEEADYGNGGHFSVYFPDTRSGDAILKSIDESWKGVSGTAARTLSVWVKIDNNAEENSGSWLYSYGNENKTGGGYRIELKLNSIEFANAVNTNSNQWCNRNVCWVTTYPKETWHHLAIVYDGSGNRKTGMKLYFDGKSIAFDPVSQNADFDINTIALYTPEIGRYMKKMAISDFRFYSRALTSDDVAVLYADEEERNNPDPATHTIVELQRMIDQAISDKARTLTIPAGTYRGKAPLLTIKDAVDLEIIADGVLMVCETQVRALAIENCKNLKLKGLTIDYDPLTFTQGDIINVGSNYVDVKIHKGYPVRPYSRIDIIDSKTHYRKRGSKFIWGATAEKLDGTDDVIRVYQDGDMVNVAKVGDMATMSTGPEGTYGAPHVVTLTGKGGLILEDVTVFCGPGFGIFEEGGEGGTILKNCKVIPGPTPEGATQPRMLSVSWDAIQHAGTHVGPIVENCIVRDAGDDSWSVQVGTAPALIIKAFPASNRITFKDSEGNDITKLTLAAGDILRESVDPTSEYRVIDKVSGNIVLLKSGETFPDTWREGMMLYTPNRRCENFVLRNCHFRSSGRVLVKAGKGVIENNRFEDTHSGVTVNSESVLTAIGDLVIRNNDISGTGHFMPASYSNQAGSISVVDGSGTSIAEEGSFRNIVIENNTFSDVSGVNIAVTSANNVIIKDNKFYKTGMTTPNNTGADYGIDQNAVIYVNNVSDIIFDNNPVYSRGLGALVKEDGQVRRRNDKNGGVYDDVSAVEKSVLGKSDNQAYYSGENLVLQVFTPLQGEVPVYIYGISGVLESVCVGKFVSGKASVSVRFGAKGLKVIQIPTSDGIISIKLVI